MLRTWRSILSLLVHVDGGIPERRIHQNNRAKVILFTRKDKEPRSLKSNLGKVCSCNDYSNTSTTYSTVRLSFQYFPSSSPGTVSVGPETWKPYMILLGTFCNVFRKSMLSGRELEQASCGMRWRIVYVSSTSSNVRICRDVTIRFCRSADRVNEEGSCDWIRRALQFH